MAMIIPGIFIPTSFNKTMVLRNKRGILNRVESSLVCNVSATNFRVNPDFSAVFGYLNDNLERSDNERKQSFFEFVFEYRNLLKPRKALA